MKKYACVVFFKDTSTGRVVDAQVFWLAAPSIQAAKRLARWAWSRSAWDNTGSSAFAGEVIDLKRHAIECVDVYTVREYEKERRECLGSLPFGSSQKRGVA